MRKLIILLDEWNYNRVFIEKELRLLLQKYDISIVCNDEPSQKLEGIDYYTYSRNSTKGALGTAIVGFFFNRTVHTEWKIINRTAGNKIAAHSEIFRFYLNSKMFLAFLKKNQLLNKDDDTIFYSYWNFYKCFTLTEVRNKYPRIRVISRIHGYDLYKNRMASGYEPFKAAMLKGLDRLIFISEQGLEYYKNQYILCDELNIKSDCNTEKITENILGDVKGLLDKCIISRLGTDNDTELREYARGEDFIIVSCSSLIPLKAVNRIIEALALIDNMSVKWVHFGGGIEEDSLKALADKLLKNKQNIKYDFRGHTANAELMKYYYENTVDAFITTSTTEGMPMSIMEAMSFGIPVIASPVGNIPRMMEGNGILLSDEFSNEDVARAILTLGKMPINEYMHIRNNCRYYWEKNYRARDNFRSFVENIVGGVDKE